jgi:hypothetical protein
VLQIMLLYSKKKTIITFELIIYFGQKIALSWMVQKETSSSHCSGGILADDQVHYLLSLLILISNMVSYVINVIW